MPSHEVVLVQRNARQCSIENVVDNEMCETVGDDIEVMQETTKTSRFMVSETVDKEIEATAGNGRQ